jgi:glutamate racemase
VEHLAEERGKPVGLFDSGVGGLTVLAAAVQLLPAEDFVYYGDTANAPYGEKTKEEVRTLSVRIADMLLNRGCKAIVVACNTATSAAVDLLREVLPVPVIGMEPAIKPALAGGGRVLVMATPLTLQEEKFRDLCRRYCPDGDKIAILPCPGLVELIERGETSGPEVDATLRKLFSAVDLTGVSSVVLGCTHYLFVRDALRRLLPPGTKIYDGNYGTVRQLQRVLEHNNLLRPERERSGNVEFLTSGGRPSLLLFRQLYRLACAKPVLP